MKEKREFFRVDADVPIFIRFLAEDESDNCGCSLSEEGFDEKIKRALLQRINISGAGICFQSDKPYLVGDILEMRLMLENAYPGVIALCTRVIRSEKPAKNYCIAVEYIGLTSGIRELITNFVFRRERALIKDKRVGWL